MRHEITHEDMLDRLIELAKDYGVRDVRVGDWATSDDSTVLLGQPPAMAALVRHNGRVEIWLEHEIEDASDVEEALHELAHHVVGLEAEEECYREAIKWSLRFPPKVAERVCAMYHEVMG